MGVFIVGVPKLTKHRLICETIKSDILNGTYPPGAKIPPETKLTQRFKASRMTVNRAIKELQMAGYVRRTRGSGTYVLARQVAEPLLLAIMIPGFPNVGIYHRLVRSIEETAFSLGYSVIFCNADFSFDKARTYVKEMVNHKISGIFYSPIFNNESIEKCIEENCQIANLLFENRIPFLCIDSMLENFEEQSYIVPDNAHAAMQLMEEAIKRGHKKVIFLHNIMNSSARLRIKGARKAMTKNGLDSDDIHVHHVEYFFSLTREKLDEMIRKGISLIYSMDDLMALQVMNHIKSLNLSIPEDISLVSHDDLDFAEGLGLTTVHQDLEKEGEEAVLAMHRILKGEVSSIHQLLPSKIIIRKSLGYAPGMKPE
jgi:GntR family transcriptional regulator, arabinose operon transcriptional repressor